MLSHQRALYTYRHRAKVEEQQTKHTRTNREKTHKRMRIRICTRWATMLQPLSHAARERKRDFAGKATNCIHMK